VYATGSQDYELTKQTAANRRLSWTVLEEPVTDQLQRGAVGGAMEMTDGLIIRWSLVRVQPAPRNEVAGQTRPFVRAQPREADRN
jgi:hypothetical protein